MLEELRLADHPGLRYRRSPDHNPVTLGGLWQGGGRRLLLGRRELLERAVLLPAGTGWYQSLYNDAGALAELIALLPAAPPPKLAALPAEVKEVVAGRWPGIHFNDHQLYAFDRAPLPAGRPPLAALAAADLPELLRKQPYLDEYGGAGYLVHRIAAGLSSCIRAEGCLVAWGLIQDDGSMGFLRVVESHRRRGLGAAVTADLAARAAAAGLRPLAHISTFNRTSIALAEHCGARPLGRVETWARHRTRAEIAAYERGEF